MALIDVNTWHAEKFGRPERWVRMGYIGRKHTSIRRLELRRARRVRAIETRQLLTKEFESCANL